MRRFLYGFLVVALLVSCHRLSVRTPSYEAGGTPEPQPYRREAPGPNPPARPPVSPAPVTPPPSKSLEASPVVPSPTFSPVLVPEK